MDTLKLTPPVHLLHYHQLFTSSERRRKVSALILNEEQRSVLQGVVIFLRIARRSGSLTAFQHLMVGDGFKHEVLEPMETVLRSKQPDERLQQALRFFKKLGGGSSSDLYKAVTSDNFRQMIRYIEEAINWGPSDNDELSAKLLQFREQTKGTPPESHRTTLARIVGISGIVLGIAATATYLAIKKDTAEKK